MLADPSGQILAQSPPISNPGDALSLIAAVQAIAFTATIRKDPDFPKPDIVEQLPSSELPAETQEIEISEKPHPTYENLSPDKRESTKAKLLDDTPTQLAEGKLTTADKDFRSQNPPTPSRAKLPKFQLFQGRDKQYYFRLLASNGEVILASEGYQEQRGALNGIRSVQHNAPTDARYIRQIAKNGQYFFNLQAGNHKVIGSSEMYKTAVSRDKGIAAVQRVAETAPIEIVEDDPDGIGLPQRDQTKAIPETDNSGPLAKLDPPKFQLFLGDDQQYYFHLMAGNHEIVLASEGYQTKRGCLNGVRSVQKNSASEARYRRETATNGQYCFQLTAGNHQVIGISELYVTVQNRDKGIQIIQRIAPEAPIEDLTHQPYPEGA